MAQRRGTPEPGQRDRQITLQQRPVADAVDDVGAPIDNWSTLVAVMPAHKDDVTGQERFQGQQTTAAIDTRWEINYRADMDPELIDVPKLRRVIYQGRVYDIVYATQIGRREGIELYTLASAKVA